MNVYELAEALKGCGDNSFNLHACEMLRQQADLLDKYEKVLEKIANDYPELSHDKARMQNIDHIKWAKGVLK